MWKKMLLVMLLVVVFGYAEDPQTKTMKCIVCDGVHHETQYFIEYRGQKIYLCDPGCQKHFEELRVSGKLDPITAKIEPRSMLFHQDSNTNPPLTKIYGILGLYVLIGVLFGGMSAYLALQKGLSALPAFFLGFFANVLGLCVVYLIPKKEMMFSSVGLTKVPQTRDEYICTKCGHSNHPSAKSCISCHHQLQPSAPSEVDLAGLS